MEAQSHARLRQAVLVAEELEPVETALRETLGLGAPFRDPAVAEFGLVNAVFALGDCFLEVISPLRAGTAAGRYLAGHGNGGYMAIFDLEDLDGGESPGAGAGGPGGLGDRPRRYLKHPSAPRRHARCDRLA